jgi:hypothetical protein
MVGRVGFAGALMLDLTKNPFASRFQLIKGSSTLD